MKLKNVSASQVTTFERCQRLWWFQKIAGFRLPQSKAMKLGTDVHSAIEHYLIYGRIRDDEFAKFIVSLKSHLPAPNDNCLVELPIKLLTIGSLPWLGYVDLIEYEASPMRVRDYKTTSDFRYAKTPDELSRNTQLISYAEWCYQEGYVGEIELGHTYVHTKRKTPTVKPVNVIVDREHVRSEWNKKLAVVEKMIVVAECTEATDVKPTVTACGMYGGCEQKARCGVVAPSPFKQLGSRGKPNMSFMSDLRAKLASKENNAAAAPVAAAPVAAAPVAAAPVAAAPVAAAPVAAAPVAAAPVAAAAGAEVPTGVLPPDAPSRTTTPEEAKQIQDAAKPKAGRKKMTLAEKALRKVERDKEKLRLAELEALALAEAEGLEVPETGEAAPVETAPVAAAPVETAPVAAAPVETAPVAAMAAGHRVIAAAPQTEGMILYVDCIPTRNTEYTLFEDWFKVLADKIAEEAELPDYRLLSYAQEKAAVAVAIQAQSNNGHLPQVIAVRSKASGAQDALSSLIPLASEIVRGVF